VAGALADGVRAGAGLVFVGPGHGHHLAELIDALAAGLGEIPLIGATCHGVLGGGEEIEASRAVALMAIEGCPAVAFQIGDLAGHEDAAGAEIEAQVGGPAQPEDLVVLLPSPGAYDTAAVLESVRERLATSAIVGAGAADPTGGAPALWSGRRVERDGVVGMLIRSANAPRIGITQACRPRSGWLQVTRTQGHWVLAIEGRPALDAYLDAVPGPLAADLRRAAQSVLVAIPSGSGDSDRPGGYLVRHIVGFAEQNGAFAVPEVVKPGDRIAFAVREPEAAREDLVDMLAGLEGETPALALYFNCCARGAGFFGVAGVEAAYLDRAFGPAPIMGMFGSCEIGPIGSRVELLTHTGVVALLDA
jgi:small ligand-binding sensory domain FIST